MTELTLIADAPWESPWAFHAFVALTEKQLDFALETVPLPIPDARKRALFARSPMADVPMLVHGDLGITESLAISEYLAETFPTPAHPRLFPADLKLRARARQIMNVLRTSPAIDTAELVRLASAVLAPGRTTLFDAWCIADADLGLALMRLVAKAAPVPTHVETYAHAQWERPSTQTYLARRPPPAG